MQNTFIELTKDDINSEKIHKIIINVSHIETIFPYNKKTAINLSDRRETIIVSENYETVKNLIIDTVL